MHSFFWKDNVRDLPGYLAQSLKTNLRSSSNLAFDGVENLISENKTKHNQNKTKQNPNQKAKPKQNEQKTPHSKTRPQQQQGNRMLRILQCVQFCVSPKCSIADKLKVLNKFSDFNMLGRKRKCLSSKQPQSQQLLSFLLPCFRTYIYSEEKAQLLRTAPWKSTHVLQFEECNLRNEVRKPIAV